MLGNDYKVVSAPKHSANRSAAQAVATEIFSACVKKSKVCVTSVPRSSLEPEAPWGRPAAPWGGDFCLVLGALRWSSGLPGGSPRGARTSPPPGCPKEGLAHARGTRGSKKSDSPGFGCQAPSSYPAESSSCFAWRQQRLFSAPQPRLSAARCPAIVTSALRRGAPFLPPSRAGAGAGRQAPAGASRCKNRCRSPGRRRAAAARRALSKCYFVLLAALAAGEGAARV